MIMLEGAFLDIEHQYRDRHRHSGVPVVLHSLRVAVLLCRIGADIKTTIAGLLHDILEDTQITETNIRSAYGPWYSDISNALKKTPNTQHTHEKLLQAGRRDIRSLRIKFCDRLDNMREIQWLPDHKRQRISRETLNFYLPYSEHIGIPSKMREELRSISIRFS